MLDVASNQTAFVGYSATVDPFPITTGALLPSGIVGTAYNSVQLAAPDCGSGCTWTTNGAPPSGITLSSGGLVSGTPTATFTGSFTAIATGPNGSARKQFSLS